MIIVILAAAVGSVLLVRSTPKRFSAFARLYINVPVTTNANDAVNGVSLSAALLPSYAAIATSKGAAQQIVANLHITTETYADVQGKLSADKEPNTLIIDVTASDENPNMAVTLADEASRVLMSEIAQLNAQQQDPVQAEIIDTAAGTAHQVAPTPKSTVALGTLLGVVAAGILVALLEALDRSVRTPEQGQTALGVPMVGTVPRRQGRSKVLLTDTALEPYRALRTAVRFLDPDNPPVTILVTSPVPDDGKTTTAVHLALAFAESGERVALVDGDMRRSGTTSVFEARSSKGLSTLVARQTTFGDATKETNGLLLLPSGPTPPNPSELLGSQTMQAVLERLAKEVDVVIIDAPPVLAVTDAVVLATQVDAVLVVIRAGQTSRQAAAETRRRLEGVDAPVAGFVLNGVDRGDSMAYYDYAAYTLPA